MRFLKLIQSAFGAALCVAVLASPAAAHGKHWNGNHGKGRGEKGSIAAPAPIAGVGLAGIGVAGAAIYWIRRRRRKPNQD
jgi:hypothetical protein